MFGKDGVEAYVTSATALTKGFIIGALVVPAVLVAIIPLIGVLAATAKPPAVTGTVLVIDNEEDPNDLDFFVGLILPQSLITAANDAGSAAGYSL